MLGHESTTQSLGDNTARSLPIAHLLIQYIHGCVLYQSRLFQSSIIEHRRRCWTRRPPRDQRKSWTCRHWTRAFGLFPFCSCSGLFQYRSTTRSKKGVHRTAIEFTPKYGADVQHPTRRRTRMRAKIWLRSPLILAGLPLRR